MSLDMLPIIRRFIDQPQRRNSIAIFLVLLGVMSSPALAAPAVGRIPVAEEIASKAYRNEAVEALVLLDDAMEQRSETGVLHRLDVAAYNKLMGERQFRLDRLKALVKADLVDPDLEFLQDYSVLPVLHVRMTSGRALDKLLRHGKVLSIDKNARNELFLGQSLPLIEQPAAWDGGNGYGGAGASIAVLDTGADYTRTAFGSCTAPGIPDATCKVVYAKDFAASDNAFDDNGHGTNVAGIVLGVAPAAKIAALDVFRTDGYAYTSDIIAAIDWCVANKATYKIAAINMSLGGGRYYSPVSPTDSWGNSIQKAVDAGIVVAAASGNNAYTNSMSLPAAYTNVVSVGAVYDANLGSIRWSVCSDSSTLADKVTCFSNSAAFLSMLAPGASIKAADITMSGTSQASPHVAGAAAVLRSAFPGESVQQSVARLQEGPFITDSRNGVITPRLDLVAALGVVTEPPLPTSQTLQLSSATYSVSEGVTSLSIPVTRAGGTTGTVSVQYATADGTAQSGSDYTAKSGTLSFAAGVSTQNIVITISNDTFFESDESFTVTLVNPVGASLGAVSSATATIVDDDKNVEFESVALSVNEGGDSVTLWVKRLGATSSNASVKYSTANGTARSKSDYTAKSGTLSWAAGDAASKSIVIRIVNDSVKESSETFKVNLSSAVGATLGANKTAVVTIADND
jgi:subtilisin family serine protease